MENIIIGITTQGVYAILAFTIGYLWNKSKGLSEKVKSSDRGMRVLLKIQLKTIHQQAVERGSVTYEEEDLAEEIYRAYHGLGGNGQGTAIMQSIRKMRVMTNDTENNKAEN